MKEEKHCCDNCKYFKSYYVKYNLHFLNVCSGTCACENSGKSFVKQSLSESCGLWEKVKSEKEKFVKPVEKAIKQMHEQLNRIEEVLFDKQTED